MDKSTHDLFGAYTKIYEQTSMDDMLRRAEKIKRMGTNNSVNTPYNQPSRENLQKQNDFARMAKPTTFSDRIRNTFKEIYTDPINELKKQPHTPVQLEGEMYENYKNIRDKYYRHYTSMLKLASEKDEREYRSRMDGTPSSEWNQDTHGGLDVEEINNIARFLYDLDSAYITGDTAALISTIKSRGGDVLFK